MSVHDDVLFVGLREDFLNLRPGRLGEDLIEEEGVYVFDAQTETWSSTGLNDVSVHALLSYRSSLYAGTEDGIHRAEDGGVVTTWEHMTQ